MAQIKSTKMFLILPDDTQERMVNSINYNFHQLANLANGIDKIKGDRGEPGLPGDNGPKGDKGDRGYSIYELKKDENYSSFIERTGIIEGDLILGPDGRLVRYNISYSNYSEYKESDTQYDIAKDIEGEISNMLVTESSKFDIGESGDTIYQKIGVQRYRLALLSHDAFERDIDTGNDSIDCPLSIINRNSPISIFFRNIGETTGEHKYVIYTNDGFGITDVSKNQESKIQLDTNTSSKYSHAIFNMDSNGRYTFNLLNGDIQEKSESISLVTSLYTLENKKYINIEGSSDYLRVYSNNIGIIGGNTTGGVTGNLMLANNLASIIVGGSSVKLNPREVIVAGSAVSIKGNNGESIIIKDGSIEIASNQTKIIGNSAEFSIGTTKYKLNNASTEIYSQSVSMYDSKFDYTTPNTYYNFNNKSLKYVRKYIKNNLVNSPATWGEGYYDNFVECNSLIFGKVLMVNCYLGYKWTGVSDVNYNYDGCKIIQKFKMSELFGSSYSYSENEGTSFIINGGNFEYDNIHETWTKDTNNCENRCTVTFEGDDIVFTVINDGSDSKQWRYNGFIFLKLS